MYCALSVSSRTSRWIAPVTLVVSAVGTANENLWQGTSSSQPGGLITGRGTEPIELLVVKFSTKVDQSCNCSQIGCDDLNPAALWMEKQQGFTLSVVKIKNLRKDEGLQNSWDFTTSFAWFPLYLSRSGTSPTLGCTPSCRCRFVTRYSESQIRTLPSEA